MALKTTAPEKRVERRFYRGAKIPLSAIRRYVREIVERFRPDKVILFGSFAYGKPHRDSDVDLLVVMPCPDEVSQAIRIRLALETPFPMDLIVRTPTNLRQRIKDEDWFLREITARGKVLHEKANRRMASKSPGRSTRRKENGKRTTSSA